jgi:hypothetical protein
MCILHFFFHVRVWIRRLSRYRVEGGLGVVDRGAFVVGEGDVGQHLLEVLLRLQQLASTGVLEFFGVQKSQRAQVMRCWHCSKRE